MPDPKVFEIGRVVDLDGGDMPVGVDYDAVVIAGHRFPLRAIPMLRSVIDTAVIRAQVHMQDMEVADRA